MREELGQEQVTGTGTEEKVSFGFSCSRYKFPLQVPVICYLLLVSVLLLLVPVFVASAQIKIFDTPDSNLSFTTFAQKLADVANVIIPFLIGIAFVLIIWGIFNYIRSAGDAEKVAEGRKIAVYGVIALFMMLSFWGFVMIIKNSLFGQ